MFLEKLNAKRYQFRFYLLTFENKLPSAFFGYAFLYYRSIHSH